jgi:DNA-binding MarR family transcriptional regulator
LTPTRLKNSVTEESRQLEAIAQEMFRLNFMFWTLRHRNRITDPFDLTDPEFVTLDTLAERGMCTVGEIQQVLDVRPAQMSRIIRSLENKLAKALIACSINPTDKRKINVSITEQGRKARDDYKSRWISSNVKLLKGLSDSEQVELERLINRFHQIMTEQLGHQPV